MNDQTPEPLVVGPEDAEGECVSPDGAWVLYRASPLSGDAALPVQIMRTPTTGGPSQLVLKARPDSWVGCARSPASLCVLGEPTENGKQIVFTAFDPVKGRGAELMKIDTDPKNGYTGSVGFLSPDGTRIAVCLSPEGAIHILSLRGQPEQEIRVKGWSNIRSLRWAADGKGLFVGSGSSGTAVLLHVDLQGNAQVLWQQPGSHWLAGVASPDGLYLAIAASGTGSNMWMMEDF